MNKIILFMDLFKSIRDCRKSNLLKFLPKRDVDLMQKVGYLKKDLDRSSSEIGKN